MKKPPTKTPHEMEGSPYFWEGVRFYSPGKGKGWMAGMNSKSK